MLNKQLRKSRKSCYTDTRTCFSRSTINCCCRRIMLFSRYRKIPKINPGAYIFQRLFLRGLFLEGLIIGGTFLRREICVSKSIGLACLGKEIYHFCFLLLCIRAQIPSTSLPGGGGAYIWRGDETEGFLRYDIGGLIHGGAYFRNFTVYEQSSSFLKS